MFDRIRVRYYLRIEKAHRTLMERECRLQHQYTKGLLTIDDLMEQKALALAAFTALADLSWRESLAFRAHNLAGSLKARVKLSGVRH